MSDDCLPQPLLLADIRCQSYGNMIGNTLGSALANPALFNDPASNGPAGSPDFTCTDSYPVQQVVYDVQVSLDGGVTWTQDPSVASGPVVVATWNNAADIQMSDAGFGMGVDELINWLNARNQVIIAGVTFYPRGGNGWMVDYNSADAVVRVLYGHIFNSDGGADCRLDPYHRQWVDDFYVMGTDGDAVWLNNGASGNVAWVTSAPTPADYAASAATHDITSPTIIQAGTESCGPIP